ncbi:MAG TPA: PEGA domain-containing protein [Candidatus Saccharimonadales bacterium]
MEFLDPKKQRAHIIRLFIGYFLIATALILTTIILLYQARGFGIKNGQVIQNGLIFVSSNPPAADIFVNGQKRSEQTNVRLLMPAGPYTFELKRDGYRTWKRAINVEGGTVARFDYPLLFPTTVSPITKKTYTIKPRVVSQSPDRRWIVTQAVQEYNHFEVFDLTKSDKDPVVLTLPEATTKLIAGIHTWKFIEWSNDNSHFLLQHSTDDRGKLASEYILIDRESPEKSVNLTTVLGMNPTTLQLLDKKFNKFVLHTADDKKLYTASLDAPGPVVKLERVLSFKTYDDNKFLYATDVGAPAGKVIVSLLDGAKTYPLRQVATADRYMLELAKYDSKWYVVAGSPAENRTYIYKNPQAALDAQPGQPLVPVQVLKTAGPTHVSFSENTRFVMAQNDRRLAVYDAENDKGYAYEVGLPIDAPQTHAMWIDGHHLAFVSSGKSFVFDYDNTNQAILAVADPSFDIFFDRDFKSMYTISTQLVKAADGKDVAQFSLDRTSLRAPKDR